MSPRKSHSKVSIPKSSASAGKKPAEKTPDQIQQDKLISGSSIEIDMTSKPSLQVRPLENPNPEQHVASSTALESKHGEGTNPPDSASTPIDIDDASSMPDNVTRLSTNGGSEIFVIGTAHFSKKSVQDVRRIVSSIKPNAVLLELCIERQFILDLNEEDLLRQNSNFSIAAVRQAISDKGLVQGLVYSMFVKMSADLTEKLGMAPGGELRAGAQEAIKVPGCLTVLIDRPVSVTIARAVASATLWQKVKLICHLLSSNIITTQEEVEKCKDKDMLEKLLEELGGEFPGLKKVILDERNVFLAHKLLQFTTSYENELGPQKIVAVVGIAHVAGIVENWCKTTDEEVRQVSVKPKGSKVLLVVSKTIKYSSIALLVYVGFRTLMPTSLQASISNKIFQTKQ